MVENKNVIDIGIGFEIDKSKLTATQKEYVDAWKYSNAKLEKLSGKKYEEEKKYLAALKQEIIRFTQDVNKSKLTQAAQTNKKLTAEEIKAARDASEKLKNEVIRRDNERIAAEKSANSRVLAIMNQARNRWSTNEKERTRVTREENKKRLDAEKENANSYMSKWQKAFGTLTRYASAGALIGIITQVAKKTVTAFLNIEAALSKVRAITNATAEDQKKLESAILGVAASIGISTDEASKFVVEMAKMGKTPEEIAKLTKEAGTLSSILGEDLSSSGKLIVTTMNQFGLVMGEAGRVTGTFYSVIKNSPMAVDDLKTAMQYVGTAADAAGLQIEELGVMISFLSNNGLRASKIGTGLRNVILNLSKSGKSFKEAAKAMAEEGLTLAEAMEEFGIRGSTAAALILNNWDELSEKMENAYPRSAEAFAAQTVATANSLNLFSRAWGLFLSTIKGDEEAKITQKQAESFRSLDKVLIKTEKSFVDITESYDRLKKNLSGKELVDAVANDIGGGLQDLMVKGRLSGDYIREEARALEAYLQMLTEEEILHKEIRKVESGYRSQLDWIVQNVGRDKEKAKIANEQIRGMVDEMTTVFTQAGLSPSAARTKALQLSSEMQTAISTSIEDIRNVAQLISDYNDVVADLKIRPTEAADVKIYEEKEKNRDYIMHLLCKMTGDPVWCEKEKSGGHGWKKIIDTRIKVIKANVADAIAAIKASYAESSENYDLAMSQLKSGTKEIKSPTEYFLDQKDWTGGQKIDYSEYKEYLKNNADTFIGIVTSEAEDENKRLKEEYGKTVEEKIKELKEIQKVYDEGYLGASLSPESLEQWQNGINAERTKVDTFIKSLTERFISDMANNAKDVEEFTVMMEALKKQNEENAAKLEKAARQDQRDSIIGIINESINLQEQLMTDFMSNMHDKRMAMLEEELTQVAYMYRKQGEVLESANENNLISQEEFEKRKYELEKKRIARENEVNKAIFEKQKKYDKQQAIISGIVNAAKATSAIWAIEGPIPALAIAMTAIAEASIIAATAAQISGINQRKFVPVKYETGGIVSGASHAEGGVPFTVTGSSVPREMEGGEYIVAKDRVNAKTIPILNGINYSSKYDPTHFESGGVVPTSIDSQMIEKMLKTPLRAVITTRDLDREEKRKAKTTNRTTIWK